MKLFRTFVLISFLSLNFIFFGCGDNKNEKNSLQNEKQVQTQAQTKSNLETPKIGKTWAAIQKDNIALKKTMEANKLENVHKFVFSISDLVNSLPGQSTGLPSDKMDKLKKLAKQVEDSAALLDEYGDAGDMKNTMAANEKFNKLLDSIKSLYPEESFN
ncbi:MAG: hypothetical protein AB1695_09530 [Stygiobacter sp.]|jgi:hypothetical protein